METTKTHANFALPFCRSSQHMRSFERFTLLRWSAAVGKTRRCSSAKRLSTPVLRPPAELRSWTRPVSTRYRWLSDAAGTGRLSLRCTRLPTTGSRTWKSMDRFSSTRTIACISLQRRSRWLPRCTPSSRRFSTFFGSFPAFFCKFVSVGRKRCWTLQR
ncbi:unnamed protein product [Symbiodinium sp. CCMP2592]|nr:unnamed protein product [Symbiodinium sp. CCMP2592]